jgi:hypothetical protein
MRGRRVVCLTALCLAETVLAGCSPAPGTLGLGVFRSSHHSPDPGVQVWQTEGVGAVIGDRTLRIGFISSEVISVSTDHPGLHARVGHLELWTGRVAEQAAATHFLNAREAFREAMEKLSGRDVHRIPAVHLALNDGGRLQK